MQLKLKTNKFIVTFDIYKDYFELQFKNELLDLISSFEDAILINKKLNYNELIKIQSKHNKYILIPNENIKKYDALRVLLKLINNFILVTEQLKYISLYKISMKESDEIELVAFSTELYAEDISEITFSPLLRTKWSNPQLINKIILFR